MFPGVFKVTTVTTLVSNVLSSQLWIVDASYNWYVIETYN